MRRIFLQVSLLAMTLSFATLAARGQAIVHALTGKVTAISTAGKIIEVSTDDGSDGRFDIAAATGPRLQFENNVKALTTPASAFTKSNCQVVVFYIGDDYGSRTTVALEDLGAGPLEKSLGTVVKLDKHAQLLTIRNDAGVQQAFHIDAKTLADGMMGVVPADKFDASKGMKVRVTASNENGTETALFIRALSL